MLKLFDIKKDYVLPSNTVHALKGISINFRKSELVSILGPSGCGKTTLLNIIGGLDKYTSGDLIVNGISTKEYRDRDWDIYRNHYIGFVFQSYNLIPHLNVLQNVELALTISGVSRSQRKAMATAALERVGLGEQLKKKPSQISGGQCQRVAIARALVNNPKIILADEPTGALDTETSVQIMDLLQEISDERLVIMVTHNPQLAQKYSTRIIELLDGTVISDSNPYDGMPVMIEPVKPIEQDKKEDVYVYGMKEAEFKALTPMKQAQVKRQYNWKNRANKRKLAVPKTEEPEEVKPDTSLVDFETSKFVATISTPTPEKPIDPNKKKVKEKKPKASMSFFTALSLSARNLWTKKFRTGLIAFAGSIGIIGIALVLSLTNGFDIYIKDLQTSTLVNMPVMISSLSISVDTNSLINMVQEEGEEYPENNEVVPYSIELNSGIKISANILSPEYVEYVSKIDKNLLNSIKYTYSFQPTMATHNYRGELTSINITNRNSQRYWNELLDTDFVKSQYDVIYGKYPENYDEIVLVVDQYNYIHADVLELLGYQLNYKDDSMKFKNIPFSKFVYDETTNPNKYTIITNNNRYYPDTVDGKDVFSRYTTEEAYNEPSGEDNIDLKIVGVIRPNKNVVIPFIPSGLAYTKELSEMYLNNCMESDVAQAQLDNNIYNVLNGNEFSADFSSLVTVLTGYGINEKDLVNTFKSMMTVERLKEYLGDTYSDEQITQLVEDISDEDTINGLMATISHDLDIPASTLKGLIAMMVELIPDIGLTSESVLTILDSAYETQLQRLGATKMPSSIYLYPKTFEDKDKALAYLDEWNTKCDASGDYVLRVSYTDAAGTVSTIVNWIVKIVSGIFIAFAAISLVVSSIMIAIVTYISVLERTTEIGVLRSIGARKLDIANVFNAETTIIGLISGVLGIIIAWILDFPINAILHSINSQVPPNFAQIAWWHAFVLIALAIVLNVLAGFIPSIIASKKDPVVALRSNQ